MGGRVAVGLWSREVDFDQVGVGWRGRGMFQAGYKHTKHGELQSLSKPMTQGVWQRMIRDVGDR